MRPKPVHEPGPSGPGDLGSTGSNDFPPPPAPPAPDYAGWKAVLTPEEIRRALTRIAHEILERTHGGAEGVLLGIPTRGVYMAGRLAGGVGGFEGAPAPVGSLGVPLPRDDLRLRPARALQRTQ